jgi:LPXTG-motif cell wall-anchored protein
MSILPRFPRFALVPFVPLMVTGFSVGWGLATPAGADVTGDPITDQCAAAFASRTTSPISLTTDPPVRSNVQPGQHVQLDVAWDPGWDSLSSVLVCVRVGGKIDRDLSMIESPGVDDGSLHHDFIVPDGLVDGEAICVRGVMTGNPAGDATQETFVSRQSCFDVPVPEDTAPPTTTPTTAPTPASTTASSPSAPAPPPAGSVSDETPPPQPAAPTADLYADSPGGYPDSPGESAAGSGDAPAFPVFAPAPEIAGGPVPLPILPETGFGGSGRDLAGLGFAAVGLGLPALLFGRRRRRAVFGGWS